MDNKRIQNIDEIAAVCSDCGNCLFACPVYNAELLEPTSPRGKVNLIKSLRDGRLNPEGLNKKFIYQCALCGSCQHICTKGVEFVNMMIDYRTFAAKGKNIPFLKKIILSFYQSLIFKKFIGVVDILAKTPFQKKFMIPRRRKACLRPLLSKKPRQEQYDILLFPGCVLRYFYPEIIEKTVRFLERKGFSVALPRDLECCGFPYLSQGWKKKFIRFREKNQKIFARYRFKYIVVPCGTGAMTFKKYYNLQGRGETLEIYELTEFFYKYIKDAKINNASAAEQETPRPGKRIKNLSENNSPMAAGGVEKTTFHDPCHHLKSLGISEAPRYFMRQLGENFVDDSSALCCGFGGVFSVGFPSTSKKILKRKEEKLKELGVDSVVTSCPGCYLQLRENLNHDVKFFIDLFDNE